MLFRPKVGKEFDLSVSLVERRKYLVEQTRSLVAVLVLITGVIAILLSGIYSLLVSDFSSLLTTWSVLAAPLGWIVGHYFRERNLEDENNEGTA